MRRRRSSGGGGVIPTVLSVFQFRIHHIWEEEEKKQRCWIIGQNGREQALFYISHNGVMTKGWRCDLIGECGWNNNMFLKKKNKDTGCPL